MPGRNTCLTQEKLSCVMPHGRQWSVAQRRWILGRDALMLHGWNAGFLDPTELSESRLTDSMLLDLAGNSIVCHCMLACLIGVFAHWPQGAANAKPNAAETPETSIDDILSACI